MAEPNWENRTLFRGDNLLVMRGMNSETVDLIATDPPFNKGKDFHATPDSLAKGASFQDRWSWKRDVHDDWAQLIERDLPSVWQVINSAREAWGDDMGAYLCFMAVRLIAMRRLLKPTGSIYLHCDSTASHYLKMLMDSIFGRKNFRSAIGWLKNDNRAKGSQHKSKRWGTQYDTLLFYSKTTQARVTATRDCTPDEIIEEFSKIDINGRRYKTGIPLWCQPSMGPRPNLCYTWRGYTNPHPSGWRLSKERMEEEFQRGNIVIRENGKLERRLYEEDYEGKPIGDLWMDISPAKGHESTGYPTQKPLALYERIIKASSQRGDIVLDPFAGCATTCVAAEKLDRQWVGIDIWTEVQDVIIDRLEKEKLVAPKYTRKTPKMRQQYLWAEELNFTECLPARTDDGKTAVAYLETVESFKKEPWERLRYKEMVVHLTRAQEQDGQVICAGCGRGLEVEFMELDNISPRAESGSDDITNRILLCSPCNRKKRQKLTLKGLRDLNKSKKDGWMHDLQAAEIAQVRAKNYANKIKRGQISLRDGIN